MPRKRSPSKQFRLTEAEKQDLDRFGCAFNASTGVFCIDWRGKSSNDALKAKVFASLGGVDSKHGPLVFLAFDIALVRPLPRYAYFPFDLGNHNHRKYLDRLTTTGGIKVCFVSDKQKVERAHQLSAPLRTRAFETYDQALKNLESFGADKYNFEAPLQLMERWIRIPEFLERLLSEDDLREISARINEAVRVTPQENRDLANSVVSDAENSLGSYYAKNRKTVESTLHRVRTGTIYINDLADAFSGNSDGLKQFSRDAIASSFSREELENLREGMKIACSFVERASNDETKSGGISGLLRIPQGISDLVRLIVVVGKISPNSLAKLMELLGIEVKGKPGRPPEDYSREYELRASGLSWSQLARQMVVESPELRAEFGALDYDSLERSQQEVIVNRIRQGVTAYANRTGKRLPAQNDASEADPPEGV